MTKLDSDARGYYRDFFIRTISGQVFPVPVSNRRSFHRQSFGIPRSIIDATPVGKMFADKILKLRARVNAGHVAALSEILAPHSLHSTSAIKWGTSFAATQENLIKPWSAQGGRLQWRLRADAHHPADHSAGQETVQEYQHTVEPSNDPDRAPPLECAQRRPHDFISA